MIAVLIGLLTSGLSGAWYTPAAAAAVVELENACGADITEAEAPPGTTIVIGGPQTHTCTGNGPIIRAEDVVLDLNGRSIRNPTGATGTEGVEVEGRRVVVTNTSSTVSVVEGFKVNLAFSDGEDGTLVGRLVDHDSDPTTPMTPNIVGGTATSVGAFGILGRFRRLTVETVALRDMRATGGVGMSLTGCEEIIVRNSQIEGSLIGVQMTACRFVTLAGNRFIRGHQGNGVELLGRVEQSRIEDNVIEDSGLNGVAVGAESRSIAITGNTIRNNGGCGIRVDPAAREITTQPNRFAGNRGGNVC